jgi:hypothetical protein
VQGLLKMNERNHKKLDDLFKAGIIIFAVLIGYFIGRNSVTDSSVVGAGPATHMNGTPVSEPIGHKLPLPGVDWDRNQRTLVLALQTTCHFCSDSRSFYQTLVRERAKFGNTRFVAVLPQTVEESRSYLNELGVSVDDIRQGSLSGIGVRGTPTLLLVDRSGVVSQVWAGRLQKSGEEEVLDRLMIK